MSTVQRKHKSSHQFDPKNTELEDYGPDSPWSNALSLIWSGDLNIVNLETSVTTHDIKWLNKVFNYQMHPANIDALNAARIDHVSLANNHTPDFDEAGLTQTIETVRDAGIKFAGAGETLDEAARPALLWLPREQSETIHSTQSLKKHRIHVYSFSDHPQDWASVPQFNFVNYSEAGGGD